MSTQAAVQTQTKAKPTFTPMASGVLQRACACGKHTGNGGECEECKKKREGMLQRSAIQSSSIITHKSGGVIQTKLSINKPGDEYEQEADRIADQVMTKPSYSGINGAPIRIQRFKGLSTEQADAAPPIVDQALASPGSPLAPAIRQDMEQRFGYNFSAVRVHSGTVAERSADAVNALAYTVGRDVVFGAGQYTPETQASRRLLAHELSHVLQQGFGTQYTTLQRQPNKPDAPEIVQAESAQKEESADLNEIETTWKQITDDPPSFNELKPWINYGNDAMALIRKHAAAAIAALRAGDKELYILYHNIKESDKKMLDFIFWNIVVYANLLASKPDTDRLINTIAGDDRQFTGRQEALETLQFLAKLHKFEVSQISKRLTKVNMAHPLPVKRSGTVAITIIVTNAYLPQNRAYFDYHIDELKKSALVIQNGQQQINTFLDVAQREGFAQALDAVQQFYALRGALKGRPKVDRKGKGKNPSQKPTTNKETKLKREVSTEKRPQERLDIGPKPVTRPGTDEDEEKKCKDICDEIALPIRWPKIMPPPTAQRILIRTPSGDPYIEPDKRSKPQRDLQKEIQEQHDRHRSGKPGAYVPRPCFKDDADPNDLYDAHHMHPLFLGGAEDEINLCALRRDYHQRAHKELNNQTDMLGTDPNWIVCKMCSGYLTKHLGQQHYVRLARMK